MTRKLSNVECDLIKMLRKIHSSKDPVERQRRIFEFQEIVWDSERVSDDDEIDDRLDDLSITLDFYQPKESSRRQSTALYDDKKLEEILEEFFVWYEEACKRKGRRCAE